MILFDNFEFRERKYLQKDIEINSLLKEEYFNGQNENITEENEEREGVEEINNKLPAMLPSSAIKAGGGEYAAKTMMCIKQHQHGIDAAAS